MNIHIHSLTFHGNVTVRDKLKCICMKYGKKDNKIIPVKSKGKETS